MNKTNIEYLTHTWNPLAMRCTPVSPGCQNCWHIVMADRLAQNPKINPEHRAAYAGITGPVLKPDELNAPFKLKKPAVIGVQFMGDLFHPVVKLDFVASIIRVVQKCPQHTFIILTKKTEQLDMFNYACGWPDLKNLWLGVTVENQEQANKRIPVLLQIPAAIRFVSVEPILESIDLKIPRASYAQLDGVICGTESLGFKPGRDPGIDAIRNLKNQCVDTNTPFFLKQMTVNNKLVKMPELDGKVWAEMP